MGGFWAAQFAQLGVDKVEETFGGYRGKPLCIDVSENSIAFGFFYKFAKLKRGSEGRKSPNVHTIASTNIIVNSLLEFFCPGTGKYEGVPGVTFAHR